LQHLNSIVQMYFQKISSRNILHGQPNYKCFHPNDFDALTFAHLKPLSETESREIYRYLSGTADHASGENNLNVFRALKTLVKEMLVIRDDQPLCRYEKLLQWHEVTTGIGEDLSICAFLAQHTERTGSVWRNFEWNTVIGHDNMQLNRLLQRGLSDNHFHLFGSAPSFQLVWLKLMNELDNQNYTKILAAIDLKKRVSHIKYAPGYQEEPLEVMHFQAALIRAVLFYYIDRKSKGDSQESEKVVDHIQTIQEILKHAGSCVFYRKKAKIQMFIERMRLLRSLKEHASVIDYAVPEYGRIGSIHHDFAGERALMYQMLLGTIGGEKIPDVMMNWFYAYLAIRIKLREELVQVNENVGFENFSVYNKRKNGFLNTDSDNRKMIQHAVWGSFASGNIRSLEIRIAPCATAAANRKWIQTCDHYMTEHMTEQYREQMLQRTYYVLHFPKEKDHKIPQTNGFVTTYRHYAFRNKLEQIADELILLRETFPREARRILGIDACAQEIGCRPEVFAPVFRKLSGHVASSFLSGTVRQWKITYHVGEDWIDFVDGLRAIDEAVLFLNMKNGDRLGHATVLGLDAKKWYEKKRRSVCLPLQDYLDNIVWLYHKLIAFDIRDCETLKGFLLNEYDKYFLSIYHDHLQPENCYYGIDMYYEAWKLRGDHPALYKNGQCFSTVLLFHEYWENHSCQDTHECRQRDEIIKLLHYYHYSASVRFHGEQIKDFEVPDLYIDGVEKVQKAMQCFVAARGISIEANPSSNYFISTMDSYKDHPISKLYNMGLTCHPEEIQNCTQMHVSINTDDKGVFHTSLENEYALMSCALEQTYQKQMVYEWLDHVREHGNQQSFLEKENHCYETL